MHFLNENYCILIQIAVKYQQYASIDSDNGLAPVWCQAFIWTNGGLIFTAAYYIYVTQPWLVDIFTWQKTYSMDMVAVYQFNSIYICLMIINCLHKISWQFIKFS